MIDFKVFTKRGLVEAFKAKVQTERKVTAEVIEFVREIDRTRAYLESDVTSIYAFLTKEIGYSRAAAQRRIDAARLSCEVPEILEDLKTGELNLSHVSLLAQGVRQKQRESSITISQNEKRQILEKFKSKPIEECEVILAQALDLELKAHDKSHLQKDESVRVEMTFSKDDRAEIERVKSLLSHKLQNPKLSELFLFLVRDLIKRKDPLMSSDSKKMRPSLTGSKSAKNCEQLARSNSTRKKDKQTKITPEAELTPRQQSSLKSSLKSSPKPKFTEKQNARGHISRANDKVLHQRDKSCRWLDSNGKPCGSTFHLQRDHIKPVWAGGTEELSNLQLLCGVHNRLKYRREAGLVFKDQMVAYDRCIATYARHHSC